MCCASLRSLHRLVPQNPWIYSSKEKVIWCLGLTAIRERKGNYEVVTILKGSFDIALPYSSKMIHKSGPFLSNQVFHMSLYFGVHPRLELNTTSLGSIRDMR
ncbi:hypothetical protein WG66_005793 [Moniliophthora roreri]|nr:hypothetical protein WG66_005793 [Moniliophthora roreri]